MSVPSDTPGRARTPGRIGASGPIGAPARVGEPDRELIRRIRRSHARDAPDPEAFELLYRRHRPAALACARACSRAPQDAEDLVSEAFLRTIQAVRSGAGPRDHWRPYLLTVIRHTAVEWRAGDERVILTPDVESWCRPGPGGDDPQRRLVEGEDRRLAARSFRTLPERWKAVLWHTLVEDDCPHQVPVLMGITPSAVTSLAFRAREGLREAYLDAHVDPADDRRCRHYGTLLGAAVRRRGVSRRLARHLSACGSCSLAYAELTDVDTALRAGARGVPAGM
ncbi:sigma-70 family RNA polymerase sigma factor [Streptomyces sp. NPDC051000]|uniref:RNA polymerase sigma factor n=1 Tax=unclassified Streptomyces TaxID=2593676 RepID=UPI00340730C7